MYMGRQLSVRMNELSSLSYKVYMYMYYHGLLEMPIPTGAFTSMQDCHDLKYPTPTHIFGVVYGSLW